MYEDLEAALRLRRRFLLTGAEGWEHFESLIAAIPDYSPVAFLEDIEHVAVQLLENYRASYGDPAGAFSDPLNQAVEAVLELSGSLEDLLENPRRLEEVVGTANAHAMYAKQLDWVKGEMKTVARPAPTVAERGCWVSVIGHGLSGISDDRVGSVTMGLGHALIAIAKRPESVERQRINRIQHLQIDLTISRPEALIGQGRLRLSGRRKLTAFIYLDVNEIQNWPTSGYEPVARRVMADIFRVLERGDESLALSEGPGALWETITQAHEQSRRSGRRLDIELKDLLRRTNLQAVLEFHESFVAANRRLNTWDALGAVCLIRGSLVGPDDFADFRSAVVGLGRTDYERFLADPDSVPLPSLAPLLSIGQELGSAAEDVFEEIAGRDGPWELFESRSTVEILDTPSGRQLDLMDRLALQRRYPRLEAQLRNPPAG